MKLKFVAAARVLIVFPLMAAGLVSVANVFADTNAGNRTDSQAVPIRLAIGGFAVRTDASDIQKLDARLTDLLTVRLSQTGDFGLVERQEIESVVKEISLSLSQLSKSEDAIKVGKMLRADWIVVGSISKVEGGDAVIVKIVDAKTGILRDMTGLALEENDLSSAVEHIATFLAGSIRRPPNSAQRIYIGIGGFEDMSINNRYPDFRKDLRASLERDCNGTSFSIVERTMVNPLLTELRLNLAGLTEGVPQTAIAQPAFFLVDGFYQSYRDDQSKINLVLRIEKIGGGQHLVVLNEPPGKDIEAKVFEVISNTVSGFRPDTAAVSGKDEAIIQLERGKNRARLPDAARYPISPGYLGGYFEQSDSDKRLKNVSEAIEAFESALLLDPDNTEAKLYLGICLLDPGIGRKDVGRDYLSEVTTTTTNSDFRRLARGKLIESYSDENDRQVINLISAMAKEAKTPLERAEILGSYPVENLHRKGLLSVQEGVNIYETNFLAFCDVHEWNAARGISSMDPFPAVTWNTFTSFERINDFDKSAGERCLDEFLPQAAEKYPGQAPYIWTAYMTWRDSPPPDISKRLRDSLVFCRDHSDKILEIQTFYKGYLPSLLRQGICSRDRELEEITAGIMQQALELDKSEGGKIQSYWRNGREAPAIYYYFAFSDSEQGKWDEALKIFEWLQMRDAVLYGSATMDADGPWGTNGTQVFAAEEVTKCRQHLGLPVQTNVASVRPPPEIPTQPPLPFELGEPVLTLGYPIKFTCDGDQIWLVDGFSPFVYQKSTGRLGEIEWPESIERNVTSIRAGKTKVWWATEGSGLVEMDKQTRHCRVYTEKDGLLLPNIRALDLADDRLWIAFGKLDVGGIGYLDLKSQNFIGFTPKLDPGTLLKPNQNSYRFNEGSPSRDCIMGLAQTSSNDLWFVGEHEGLEHYALDKQTWFQWGGLKYTSCVAGDARYIVTGGASDSSGLEISAQPGVVSIGDHVEIRKWLKPERLAPNFLPHQIVVLSLAIDGDRLWVGGLGFLALVDLNSSRVEKLCDFDDRKIHVQCLQIEGDDLWVAVENKLYRLPKSGPPTR
jgi:tetratricopeptide (TPR) repeat protein